MSHDQLRPGEQKVPLPERPDAGLFFIGVIRTPFTTREQCPRQGQADGPVCTLELDARWVPALKGLEAFRHVEVLYWMHQARRDLLLQSPRSDGVTRGTFALRSPVRPNPIATSLVTLVGIEGARVHVRGLDCLDGTPLVDLKPDRCAHSAPPAGEGPGSGWRSLA